MRDVDFDDTEAALQRRSSLFANGKGNSPFLHSGESFDYPQQAMMEVPGERGLRGAPSIAVPTPAHLYGMTGPLEVRNAFPGEIGVEGDVEEYGTPHQVLASSSPRFLGLDGRFGGRWKLTVQDKD
jgi:hypothetical protein